MYSNDIPLLGNTLGNDVSGRTNYGTAHGVKGNIFFYILQHVLRTQKANHQRLAVIQIDTLRNGDYLVAGIAQFLLYLQRCRRNGR